jgi:hypothetical protein
MKVMTRVMSHWKARAMSSFIAVDLARIVEVVRGRGGRAEEAAAHAGDALLQLGDAGEVLVELLRVGLAHAGAEGLGVGAHVVEQALLVELAARLLLRGGEGIEAAEEQIPHDLRVHRLRQGLGLRGPGDVARVRAGVARVAVAHAGAAVDAELERGDARALAERRRGDLIHGDAVLDVGPLRLHHVARGEEAPGAGGVIAHRHRGWRACWRGR